MNEDNNGGLEMKYYIDSTEQVIKDGALQEYASKRQFSDSQTAQVEYYRTLMNVTADLGKNHTFMTTRIVNSLGNSIKGETVGTYRETLPPTE